MPELTTFDRAVMDAVDNTAPTISDVIKTSLTMVLTTASWMDASTRPKLANALRDLAGKIETLEDTIKETKQ